MTWSSTSTPTKSHSASTPPLPSELYKEYEYLVHLYDTSGAITAERNPTFFALVEYSRDTSPIYEMFEFDSVPDMVVSKPHMAVVSEVERRQYLQEFVWEISHTDNHVTTHKMLEFVNKRTKKVVEFLHTEEKIKQVIGYFLLAAFSGVLAFFLLKPIWNHWLFWFLASIVTPSSLRPSTSPAAQASSTATSTIAPGPAGRDRSSQGGTGSNRAWKGGSSRG